MAWVTLPNAELFLNMLLFLCIFENVHSKINTIEPSHDKTNRMTVPPAKTWISRACTQSDQRLPCALNG